LLILNEKKRKIRELKEELEILRTDYSNHNNDSKDDDDRRESDEPIKTGKKSTKVNLFFHFKF
jgi:hypothetical protein